MAPKPDAVLGYAQALLAVAEAEGARDDVEDELFRFAKIVEGDNALREALTDFAVPLDNRKALVRDLLGGRASPHTVSLVGFIVEQGRIKQLGDVVDEMLRLSAEARKSAFAEVTSAVALDDAQKERLGEALSKAIGRSVTVKVMVDPSVVGGLVARVGDQVFDGSIATRLKEVKEQLGSV